MNKNELLDEEYFAWSKNLSAKMIAYSGQFGLTETSIALIQSLCDNIKNAIQANNAAQQAAMLANIGKEDTVARSIKQLQQIIISIKSNHNYTVAIGKELGIDSIENIFTGSTSN